MKAMKIVTIACWLVVVAVLFGLAGWFLTGTVFGARSERWNKVMPFSVNIGGFETLTGLYEPEGTYEVGTSGLNSINIDWIAGSIDIKPYDGDQIQFTEFAQRQLSDNEKLDYIISGDTLTIRFCKQNIISNIRMPQKKLEVLVPHTLSESLDRLIVDSTSGAVYASGMNMATFKIDSISGSVHLSNILSGTTDVNTTSGSVNITDTRADSIKISSISGTVRVSGSIATRFDCETTSGSINVAGEYGNVKFNTISGSISHDNSAEHTSLNSETTSGSQEFWGSFDSVDAESLSGSISIRSTAVPSSIKADSTSGSITVAIPNEGPITVYHSSVSGRFSSDIPVVIQNRGAQFELSTLSGRISIITLD